MSIFPSPGEITSRKITREKDCIIRRKTFEGGFMQNIAYVLVVNPPHVQVKADQGCIEPLVNVLNNFRTQIQFYRFMTNLTHL